MHNKKRLLLFLYGLIPSFISLFLVRNKKRIIFNSTLNQYYNFNSKYLFEYFLKYHKDYEIKFIINNNKRRDELNSQVGPYFISNHGVHNILYILKAQTWVTSSLETPLGGFFLSINRNVIHLGHGIPLKNIGLLEKNISVLKKIYYRIIKTNFSYLISTTSFFTPIWARFLNMHSEKVIALGQPRTDNIKKVTQSNSLKVLYAPTWRPWGEITLFPFDDFEPEELSNFLLENNIKIYLRVHPINESQIPSSILEIGNVIIYSSKQCPEITEDLDHFHGLITDYSSIYFDYLLTGGCCIFLPYDYIKYENEIGFTIDYFKYTYGDKPQNFQSFLSSLKKVSKIPSIQVAKEDIFNTKERNDSQKVANFIIKLLSTF